MKRNFTMTIEHLPPRELSPNARLHWARKARETQIAREEAGWLARLNWSEVPMINAVISYRFYSKSKRKRDLDNLLSSCKAIQDGLVDAGVLVSDDSEHLSIGAVTLERGARNMMCVTVTECNGCK